MAERSDARPAAERWHQRRSLAGTSLIDQAVALAQPSGSDRWTTDEIVWEHAQEQAALAFRAGDPITPPREWERALLIAERQFGRGDPRLATSLTNQALVLRRRKQVFQAKRAFERALAVWDDCWRWLSLMQRPLEAADPTRTDRTYRPEALALFSALAERGRAATAALERYEVLPEDGLETWLRVRPRRLTDARKLLAAVLLMASRDQ